MYLLDTVVLSELRKRSKHPGVVRWIRSVKPSELHLSVVTIAEIERGIERQRSINPPFAAELEAWLDTTLRAYTDRIIGIDTAIARRWGALSAQIGNVGLDLAIAATALERRLTVVTRNVSDFAPAGAPTLNPFEREPPKRRVRATRAHRP